MSSKRPEYVQIAPKEDVNSVRDRLSFIRGKRVLLIWPEDGTALTRKLDLVLVQREAKRRAIQLALVTHDAEVVKNAHDLNISVFETIGASERSRWRRGNSRMFTSRDDRPEDSPEHEELIEVASRVRNQRRIPRIQSVITRLIILVILVGVLGVTGYVVLPSATISLQLSSDILQVETPIIADPTVTDVDVENRIIPATLLKATVQGSYSIPASGTQDLSASPAIGVIIFTNQTTTAIPIPLNTTVSTSTGTPILFKTVSEATLPAGTGQQVEVPIEALQSSLGSIGNVETGLINTVIGPLEDRVTVRNLAPTTGGDNRSYTAVTAEDQERLLNIVRGQLQASAYTEMQQQLTESQLIVVETIHIPPDGERQDWITLSHNIGEVTDTLTLEMRATVEAIAIDDRFARQIVFAELSAQKPEKLLMQTDSFQYVRGNVTEISTTNQVTFSASGQALIIGQVNVPDLQAQLAGKSLDEANQWLQRTLSLAPGSTPILKIEPDWLPHLPLLPIRISVQAINPT
jgi:hypothetical protein